MSSVFFEQNMQYIYIYFFFQAEDGIRDPLVTGVQTCALPICRSAPRRRAEPPAPGARARLDGAAVGWTRSRGGSAPRRLAGDAGRRSRPLRARPVRRLPVD